MDDEQGFWTSVRAKLCGEVSAEALEAYRRAGLAVYDLLDKAELRRSELVVKQQDGWSADPATQAFFVATWNAYMLQCLGDSLLDADYEANPGTVGYVPGVTAEQARRFYEGVEAWLGHAHAAMSNAGYRLRMRSPALLPPWVEVEPCPPEHLVAISAACDKIRLHAELAVHDASFCSGHDKTAGRLREQVAAMASSVEYAASLHAASAGGALHERIESSLKGAIAAAYRLGQVAAMPSLDTPAPATGGSTATMPGPGMPGFDKWCLTDPRSRAQWMRDRLAQQAIDMLWANDPDPGATLRIQAGIEAAFTDGNIRYATGRYGQPLGHYSCCPFGAVYQALVPVRINGLPLRPGQQFTYDVSAEEIGEGGAFKRGILTGVFVPTDDIDYCNPFAGDHS